MPGFATHYLFGVDAYKELTSRKISVHIARHHHAYALGLQGPDIFFYYLPSYLLHKEGRKDDARHNAEGHNPSDGGINLGVGYHFGKLFDSKRACRRGCRRDLVCNGADNAHSDPGKGNA